MKKIFILLLVLGAFTMGNCRAQSEFSYEGSEEYGRMYDIIFHPTIENKLYAITLGNHIMESNDKGATWDILYSYPENGVHLEKLRLLPNDVLTFSATYNTELSENALYFFDIASGEVTRQYSPPITPDSNKVWISSYSIFENNPDIAMVHQSYSIGLTGYAKVYYTNDAGATWTMIYYNMDDDGIFPNNVAISPDNPQKLFIARGAGPNNEEGGLLISQDAGATWEEKLPDNNYSVITFHPANPSIIYLGTFIGNELNGHEEDLYQSLDGGDTWNTIPIDWEAGTLDNITAIEFNPLDPNNIIVLEENEVVVTHDNWATHERTIYPLDNIDGYYYGIHVSFNPFQNGELFVNADYHPLFSENGGETFSRLYNPFYVTSMVGLQQGTSEHLFHSVQRGIVHKNLGTQEENAYHVEAINLVFNSDAPVYKVDAFTEGRVYQYQSGFSGSQLKVSNDFGATFTPLHTNFFDQLINLSTDPNDPNVIWAVFLNEGGLRIDFNDPMNVQVLPITLPEADILTDVYIDPANSDRVYITVGAHVYRSEDGGSSWTDMSNGLGINPTSDIIFDIEGSPWNDNEFIVTASDGIYRTTDAAENWEAVFQASNVRKVHYSPVNELHAIATVPSGNGINSQMIYTTDGGLTWEAVPFENIAYVGSGSMAYRFYEESVDAYIATFDLGIMKYTINLSSLGTPSFESAKNTFLVYPNPATTVINITENGEKMVSASVYNSLGQEVVTPTTLHQIDVEGLTSGIYFVKIKTRDGNFFVSQILKR